MNDYRKIVFLRNFKLLDKKFNLRTLVAELLVVVKTCFAYGYDVRLCEVLLDFVKVVCSRICNF